LEIKLTFRITTVAETEETQEITAQAVNDPNLTYDQQRIMLMQRMFNQYAQVGLMRQDKPNHFILMCPSQLAFIECELGSVLLANATDVPRGGLVTE